MQYKDITGQRFGRLVALEPIHEPPKTKTARKRWLFKCDCGNEKITTATYVRRGNTSSCGCSNSERVANRNRASAMPNNQGAKNKLYGRYRSQALSRKHSFNLTNSEFEYFLDKNCTYCNSEPSQRFWYKPDWSLLYMGIDRVDSTQGYSLTNCVPCCKICNIMKRELSVEDFLAHVTKIVHYMGVINEHKPAENPAEEV